jgi:4-hydroxy-tetrahydrodipicolinate synthase
MVAQFQEACLAGDYASALSYQDRLMPLHRALFLEPNPGGPKYALSVLGRMAEDIRLPLVPPGQGTRAEIRDAMRHAGLIN